MKTNLFTYRINTFGKRLAMLITMLLVVGVGSAWGAEETITLSEFGWANASVQSEITATSATITLQKNSAGTAPTYYTSDGLRLYGVKSATTGGTISFTPKTGITISKIVFTHTSSNSGVLAIKTGTGSYSSKTWSGTLTSGNTVSLVSTNNTTSNPQVRITKIVITYTASTSADPYTVNFNAGGGTCSTTTLTESSAGVGITLPTATLNDCGDWSFAGWAEASVATETTTAPATLFGAGDNYKPTADCTLYAVYQRTETTSGGGGETEVTKSVSISSYATAHNWNNDTKYTSVTIDENITATASTGTNTGKYYTSGTNWRFYQTEKATLTLSAATGCTIKTVKVTYSVSNTGTLTYNGTNVTSNTATTINATSATFGVGNTGSATNGQVRITAIEVIYTTSGGGSSSTTYYHSSPDCGSTPITPIQLATPTNLDETNITSTSATLSWDAVANASSYVVTVVDGGAYSETFTTTSPSINITGLTAETDYLWTVQAIGDGTNYTNSEESEIGEFTTIFSGYTITYETNGGDAIASVVAMALPDPLPTAKCTHYTFEGWYTDTEFTTAAVAGATLNADITLYAKWSPKVYLTTLHPNEGVLLDTNGVQQDSIIIEYVYDSSAVDIPVSNYYQSITREGYKFKGWYNDKDGGSKRINVSKVNNQNFWAQWLEERTVTYYSIGQVYDTQTYGSGETLTLPTTNPTACDGYTFVGWTTAEQSETTTKPTLVSNTTVVSSDMILYAVYAVNSGVTETKTDVLTRNLTGVSGTTYTAWSGKTATSSAVYAGQSAGDNEAIQLRSKNSNSGIITTASGGKVTKVEVEWQSGTSSGRTLDVYGKNSTYSNATDLYNTSSQGTKLGSIIYGTSTELEITGDYEYVGLRSKDGAMYLTSISITWSSGSTTIYTTSPNCCPVNLEKPQVTYSVADGAVTLNWTMTNNAGDVADYTVACVGGETHTITATSYTFTGLTNCTEYTFTVKANGDGTDVCSSALTTVTVTPAAGSFVVTFDYGAGEGTPTQWTSGCSNGTSTTLPTPTTLPDNHTFEGWYDGTNLYVAGDNYTPTSDVTLYARYTRNTAVDIVEWDPNSVTVEIGVGGAAQVQIEKEVTSGSGTGKVADELFFSKYFEGSGSLKLLGIFNGTNADINLADYTLLRGSNGDGTSGTEFDLSILGTIKQGQEIILFAEPVSSESPYECSQTFLADKKTKYGENENPRWILCDDSSHNGITFPKLNFSGDDPLILRKNGVAIDVFGVSTKTTAPNKIEICSGRSDECWVADNVPNMDYGKTAEDFGGTIPDGVNIDDEYITAYTARVIMFRSNSVQSGANAVANNTSTFATFSTEWQVRQVCRQGADGDLTCAAYTELGLFDYNGYYTTYQELTKVDLGGNQNADGTYTIPVSGLNDISCSKIRVNVLDGSSTSPLVSSEYKVPIMVNASGVTTTDELFSKHGIEGCRDCDVVVLKNATLQKAPNGATNDMPEVRDMEVYAGGKLVVPNGTNYTMRKLVMRSKGDEVPIAEIDGTAVISDKLYHAKRIDAQKFYFFTLPYDCAVSDITYYNGEVLGARGIDYVIKYYDGAGRANGQNAGHWEEFTGATLQAGVGYILAVDASLNGDFNDNPKKEFLFPMTKTLTENSNKTVAVGTWGIGDATIGDNHKGWNLIGTPFMSHYNPISATGLKVGTYTDGEWNSEGTIFTYNESVTVPYVTMPNADGKTYTQRLASSQDLEPFKSFFIQVGKEGNVITDVAFSSAERLSKAPRRVPEVDATLWIELKLKNSVDSDVTTIIVDEDKTSEYEIGSDLEKMIGYAQKPQFYSLQTSNCLAFNALSSSVASVAIPLGFFAPQTDTYTISLNTEDVQNLEGVYLTDKTTGVVTNLLFDDYNFSSARALNDNRFSVAIVRAVTSVDNLLAEDSVAPFVHNRDLWINNAPIGSVLYVFDMLGREVISEQINKETLVYHLHMAGVYHVQIVSKDKKSVYKVVSY